MADLKAIAEELVNLTVKEVNELATILKDEYGIEPAAAAVAVVPAAAAVSTAAAAEEDQNDDQDQPHAGAVIVVAHLRFTSLVMPYPMRERAKVSLTDRKR